MERRADSTKDWKKFRRLTHGCPGRPDPTRTGSASAKGRLYTSGFSGSGNIGVTSRVLEPAERRGPGASDTTTHMTPNGTSSPPTHPNDSAIPPTHAARRHAMPPLAAAPRIHFPFALPQRSLWSGRRRLA